MEGEEFAVGCFLSIKTTLGDEFEGQIISFDLLQEGLESGPRRNIWLLKANYIKEFSLLRQDEDPLDVKKCFLDLTSLQAREDSAIRQAEADSERFGVGVTSEAQTLFDALSKTGAICFLTAFLPHPKVEAFLRFILDLWLCLLTEFWRLPVRWDKTVIVVMNEVRVSSPYLPESVSGGTPAANERVRKVLEFERKRMQTRGTSQ
ncbi:hypothetical protein GOBAR_DD28694 [Gossypium barbadense]|nr:hypothetical protein GOBAR_DD28694 [Gossypium barbadense]